MGKRTLNHPPSVLLCSGLGALLTIVLGKRKNSWQDKDYVLKWFGEKEKKAIAAYRTFVMKGIEHGRRIWWVGGWFDPWAGGLL